MAKYRLCGGFAMMPRRDMSLLKDMGNRGWHLTDLRGGMFYRFEEGQPHDYDFAFNYEPKVDADMLSLYEAKGWTRILTLPTWQIFRAEAGTAPIFSDIASERHILETARKRTGRRALVFLSLLVAVIVLAILIGLNTGATRLAFLVAWCFICVPLAFTGLPFIGYSVSLRKLKARLVP